MVTLTVIQKITAIQLPCNGPPCVKSYVVSVNYKNKKAAQVEQYLAGSVCIFSSTGVVVNGTHTSGEINDSSTSTTETRTSTACGLLQQWKERLQTE